MSNQSTTFPSRHMARLGDRRWIEKRLSILAVRGNSCEACEVCGGMVHVHHGAYLGDLYPWSYPDRMLHVLCPTCHGTAQAAMTEMLETIGALSLSRYRVVLEFAKAIGEGAEPLEAALGRGALVLARG